MALKRTVFPRPKTEAAIISAKQVRLASNKAGDMSHSETSILPVVVIGKHSDVWWCANVIKNERLALVPEIIRFVCEPVVDLVNLPLNGGPLPVVFHVFLRRTYHNSDLRGSLDLGEFLEQDLSAFLEIRNVISIVPVVARVAAYIIRPVDNYKINVGISEPLCMGIVHTPIVRIIISQFWCAPLA